MTRLHGTLHGALALVVAGLLIARVKREYQPIGGARVWKRRWRVTPRVIHPINAWCTTRANSAGSSTDAGAGNRPDDARCIVVQIGHWSFGIPLGICRWFWGDAVPADAFPCTDASAEAGVENGPCK